MMTHLNLEKFKILETEKVLINFEKGQVQANPKYM